MEKLTNKEKAKLKDLADKYIQKANKEYNGIYNTLNEEQQYFLRGFGHKIKDELAEHLKNGKKPSEYFETKGSWIFEGCILKRHREAVLYLIDNVKTFIFQDFHGQMSFRSKDYSFYLGSIHYIITAFHFIRKIDMDYADILENNLSEEQAAYKTLYMPGYSADSYLLSYEMDRGNERVTAYIKNTLKNSDDTNINSNMLTAVFRCKNTSLHEMICELLSDTRLSEELRQTICENCDSGRIEAFLMVLKTIRNSEELIHDPSVKKSIGRLLRLQPKESTDSERVDAKTLDIIINCLEKEHYIKECFKEEDSMKIYIALWIIAHRDINHCIKKLIQIIDSGNHWQVMTAGVFIKNNHFEELINLRFPELLQNNYLNCSQILSLKAVLKWHKELDVAAVYLPMMEKYNIGYSYINRRHEKIDISERYSREEAENLYVFLGEMLEKLPKNKMEFKPYVFSWNEACLTKSDIIAQLCLIAADLEDHTKIDEICVKIPLIRAKSNANKVAAIHMLLSEPKTETQLNTLISLACNKEKYARKAAFAILKQYPLQKKHFKALEDMLRYKSADMRQDLIDILLKQPEPQLFACTKRLCMEENAEKRISGLHILFRICCSDRDDTTKSKYADLCQFINNPSFQEQNLIDKITWNIKRDLA